jgi:hypothetical protein
MFEMALSLYLPTDFARCRIIEFRIIAHRLHLAAAVTQRV